MEELRRWRNHEAWPRWMERYGRKDGGGGYFMPGWGDTRHYKPKSQIISIHHVSNMHHKS